MRFATRALLLAFATAAPAQTPLPPAQPSALIGAAAEHAYNLSLVVQRMEAHVAAGDQRSLLKYSSITGRAFQFLLSRPALALPEKQAEVEPALLHFSAQLSEVQNAAMNRGAPEAAGAVRGVREAWDKLQALYPPELLNAMRQLSARIFCTKHPDVTGREGDRCPQCGRTLQRIDEFCGLPSRDPIVRASALDLSPFVSGQKADITLRLTRKDGLPVRTTDLLPTHTQRLHLFAIDSTLTDYHHQHPAPGANDGEFTFSFTPRTAGGYRVWLDLLPVATRLEEMPSLDLGSFPPAASNPDVVDTFLNAAWRLKLTTDHAFVRAGLPNRARVIVTDHAGVPCTRLEPIMASFAHFVAFHEDRQTVYHLHAAGVKDILDRALRSGPEVHVYLPGLKAGFIRLFAQVQIDGKVITAPFGMAVQP